MNFTVNGRKSPVFHVFMTARAETTGYSENPKQILDVIEEGIKSTVAEKQKSYANNIFFYHIEAGRSYGSRSSYLLRFVEDVPVVLVESYDSGVAKPLEMRRDLHNYFGTFSWGYEGSGVTFLALCILAHLFDGNAPSPRHVIKIRNELLSLLNQFECWDIPQELLFYLLEKPIFPALGVADICAKSETKNDRLEKFELNRIGDLIEKFDPQKVMCAATGK